MYEKFLTKSNIDTILNIINETIFNEFNINIKNNEKYKKIVKKLSKTIYTNLFNNIKGMNLNEYNELVVNKSLPFIRQYLQKDISKLKNFGNNEIKSFNTIDSNYSNINFSNVDNMIDLNKSLKIVNEEKKKKSKKKSGNDYTEYNQYLQETNQFQNMVNKSNNQIKKNFDNLINQNQNNFVNECSNEDKNKFIMNRCIVKDNVSEKGLSKLAFEQIVENQTIDKIPTTSVNMNTNMNTNSVLNNSETVNTSINSSNNQVDKTKLFNQYGDSDMDYKKLFSKVLVNQKDFSKNNNVENYGGESYIPNLISNYGEEAPIQPLLYQNTKTGSEILDQYTIIIDTGNNIGTGNLPSGWPTLDLTSEANNGVVTVVGSKAWQRYRVNLEDQFRVDKITDVYLKSFSLVGAMSSERCMYYVINIQEFNLRSQSNNPNLKSKIVIQNTQTSSGEDVVLTKNYSKFSNYVSTLTPANFTSLNIDITNESNQGADDGSNITFFNADSKKNRIIFELDFVTRKMKDPIFDYTINKEEVESSTT